MSVIYQDSNMNSPLNNSPFNNHSDVMNYTNDSSLNYRNNEIKTFEKNLMFKYLINHSFNLILTNFQSKFINLDLTNLNQFIITLFKRTQLSIQNFQILIILLIRQLRKNEDASISISIKHLIIGIMIKKLGTNQHNWTLITGLSQGSIVNLLEYVELNEEELVIEREELESLNEQMRGVIVNKFELV